MIKVMIRRLTGLLSHQGDNYLVLDVSGVGYMVQAPLSTLLQAEKEIKVSLWTCQIVRETSLELFGFLHKNELDFFEMLINVSGVGPKSALAILNLAPVEHLSKAIATGDSVYLTKVSGIGRKSAERIVVELKDKLAKLVGSSTITELRDEADALDALLALGYTAHDARHALHEVNDASFDTNQKIKEALKYLAQS